MLSIIISSYQEEYYKNLQDNIKMTIGDTFPYEIIKIENPGLMGVCEAYNNGASKSKYAHLLFIHEDIHFHTNNWGEKLIQSFSTFENVGILGVAGTSYKSRLPIGWWSFQTYNALHLDQVTKEKKIESYRLDKAEKVLIVDGVFLAMRKEAWEQNKFNENNKHFHGYDIEISIDISKRYQNYIINDIVLEHFSSGVISKNWLDTIIDIYSRNLFISRNASTSNEIFSYEVFLRYLRRFDYSKKERIIAFFKFYRPYLFNLKDNYKILNMFSYYLKSKK